MKNRLLTLATIMTMGSFAQANEMITQVLRFGEELQITVSTRSYCNNPKATLTLVAVSQKAAVYNLELIPTNRMFCAPGNKEAVVEVQVPADFRSEKLVIVSTANIASNQVE